jgi:dephospho-CoA kinase
MARRLIGLTGGIATGKTTVSNYLAQKHHLPVLDADLYAREAVQLGSPILTRIIEHFGDALQLSDRSLNRSALGQIIFHNPSEKQWLESQIHPFVRQRFQEEINRLDSATVVLVIPLLFEAKLENTVTEIWVVSCSYPTQIKRLMQRNNFTESEAMARINNQIPLTEKINKADIVLDNNSEDLDNLYQQIDRALIKA